MYFCDKLKQKLSVDGIEKKLGEGEPMPKFLKISNY